METEETPGKKILVVYRNDGKTPDMRYKSSRDFVLAQHVEAYKKKEKDWKTPELRYKSPRYYFLSEHLDKNKTNQVQIKPVGKKPVWKTGS